MSAQFLQSYTPAENQTIRVNSAIIRGDTVVSGVTQCNGNCIVAGRLELTGTALTGGFVKLPELTNYVQPTANNANVAASTGGVAPEQFMISTFETSAGVGGDIAAGASVSFDVFHSGVVAGKTMILCSKAGSYNGLIEVNDYVSGTIDNQFTVTRHNHGATTASGTQQLIFKLIQTA